MKTTATRELQTVLTSVTVRDAMHEGVITCDPKASLEEVARLMATRKVHAIVATDADPEDRRAWGVVSDLDLVSAAALGATDVTAGQTATTEAVTVGPDETLAEAVQLMREHAVAHLLVTDSRSGRPIGILSTLDVAREMTGQARSQSALRVADIMRTEVATVAPSAPLKEVARLLVDYGISGLPVVENGRVIGVVSERDLLAKLRVHQPNHEGLLGWLLEADVEVEKHWAETAGDAMTTPARTIEPWRTVAAAASLMAEEAVKRLPVVHDGKLVGIVSRADIVRAFARSDRDIERDVREGVVLGAYWISPSDVEIVVSNGHVTLTGCVENEGVRASLPATVATVPGVVTVESHLGLRR
jgi:CBS domain-containing protein